MALDVVREPGRFAAIQAEEIETELRVSTLTDESRGRRRAALFAELEEVGEPPPVSEAEGGSESDDAEELQRGLVKLRVVGRREIAASAAAVTTPGGRGGP